MSDDKSTTAAAMEYAQGWRPQEGDTIIGVVAELGRGYSEYRDANDGYPIVTLTLETDAQVADGTKVSPGEQVSVHCFHTALENKVKELRPVTGERIGFTYKGEVPSKDGKRTYHSYVVRMPGRNQADFWGDTPSPAAPAPVTTDVPWEDDSGPIPF